MLHLSSVLMVGLRSTRNNCFLLTNVFAVNNSVLVCPVAILHFCCRLTECVFCEVGIHSNCQTIRKCQENGLKGAKSVMEGVLFLHPVQYIS